MVDCCHQRTAGKDRAVRAHLDKKFGKDEEQRSLLVILYDMCAGDVQMMQGVEKVDLVEAGVSHGVAGMVASTPPGASWPAPTVGVMPDD